MAAARAARNTLEEARLVLGWSDSSVRVDLFDPVARRCVSEILVLDGFVRACLWSGTQTVRWDSSGWSAPVRKSHGAAERTYRIDMAADRVRNGCVFVGQEIAATRDVCSRAAGFFVFGDQRWFLLPRTLFHPGVSGARDSYGRRHERIAGDADAISIARDGRYCGAGRFVRAGICQRSLRGPRGLLLRCAA